jgi:hemerythrin-like domain-containing protein
MTNPFGPNIGADLERIHRVISRGLDVAVENTPRLLTDLEGPPHQGYLDFVQSLATVLDGHHELEDQVIFPFFRERVPEAPYEHLMVQHQEMFGNLGELRAALVDLRAGKRIMAATERLAEALRRLDATWGFHIETEESHLAPERVAQVATVEEQEELRKVTGRFNEQHVQPAPLCVPFVLYNLDVEDRAVMASILPPEVTQELVPGAWKAQWASMRSFLLD